MKRHAFTLVEMLVVIAVIGIVAAILFPVFAQARRRGQQTTCLSNLRQLGQAAFLYMQDSDDVFPLGGDASDVDTNAWQFSQGGKYWLMAQNLRLMPEVMAAQVKDQHLWECPADNGFNSGGLHENVPLDAYPTCFEAFGMSYLYVTLLGMDHQTITSVRAWSRKPPYSEHEPADIPLFYDQVGHWHGGSDYKAGRLNMVMVDGHAISVSRAQADHLNSILFTIPTASVP